MTPKTRRVLQAVLYEFGAVAFVGPVLGWAFDKVFGLPQSARSGPEL